MVLGETGSVVIDVDTFFLLWAGGLVFCMHLGFAMLSAGSVRAKNTTNILVCIILDATVCCIAWFLTGFAFAFGTPSNPFIGLEWFAGESLGSENAAYSFWFFEFTFAATAATIVSGTVAERARFETYLSYSFLLSLLVYPVTAHWIWGGGFLQLNRKEGALLGVGALDFAGCGPVHMVGGVAGVIAAKIMGPRVDLTKYNNGEIPGHSSTLTVLGTFILWVGWFGFNAGSTIRLSNNSEVAGRAAANTMLASAGGTLAALLLSVLRTKHYSVDKVCNGCLAGLVSITSGCSAVMPWAALVIGGLGGIMYSYLSTFVSKVLKIDDPLDATALHFGCALWGLISVGFFAKPSFVMEVGNFSNSTRDETISGVFYGGNGALLLCQVIEILSVFAWVAAVMFPYFALLHKLGVFRVSKEYELLGLDLTIHGGPAYPLPKPDLELPFPKNSMDSMEGKSQNLMTEESKVSQEVAKTELAQV